MGIAASHAGNFTQGQTGAIYTITATNSGNAPTSGVVTVSETLPAGLTLVGMTGTGWTSSGNARTRSDALAAGAAYPAITVTVNVAANATSPQINAVSASGGGSGSANTTDSTTVVTPQTPAVLSIVASHTGNFAQGQTGATCLVTVTNQTGVSATSGVVTVTETLPAGLTLVSMTGAGWTCSGNACARSDALAGGSSYAGITVTVNVAANASSPQVNSVSVSGGGPGSATASDPTTVVGLWTTLATSATSIWSTSAVPGTRWLSDSPVTLGVKFRSDASGNITGIRFYKGVGNNGTHVGLLYSSSGTLLAQATFSGETASGWQQVSFSTPVAITANTIYVAAYFSTSGFAYDAGYFTNTGVDNAPLHALQTGVDGPNGVYAYGASAVFPASSFGDANYWADVVFSASGSVTSSPDLTITESHTGNFTQGQTGAAYIITTTNSGNAPTSGTVTVTETLPATGLTAVSMLGTNWTCTQPAGPCSRSDALAAVSSYGPITVTVNVSS
ncbi:MAG: DUF4082 domain-containing protein, partial [Bryobacteraceae bacterium]